MGWLQIALSLIQLAPSILQMIMQVEQAFTGTTGTGAAKKAIVMNTVTASGVPADVQPKISNLIDQNVASLNAAGVFKKGQ